MDSIMTNLDLGQDVANKREILNITVHILANSYLLTASFMNASLRFSF